MGLDMNLTKRHYVKNYDHTPEDKRTTVTVNRAGAPLASIKPERISYIIEDLAYWRKANAIHQWFVDNCQEGNDDCRDAYVSRDQLQELLNLCLKVKATAKIGDGQIKNGERATGAGWEPIMEAGKVTLNPEEVAAILPTASGFFFGSTDYDEYYMEDIDYTINTLTALLAEPDDGASIYYHSSW